MKPLVIKFGGSAMTEVATRRGVAQLIATLADDGQLPIVVHGGGPFIKAALTEANLETTFVRGLRVTTAESLVIIEACLTMLGKTLAFEIGRAVGLTGRDSSVLWAKQMSQELGLVGEMQQVRCDVLNALLSHGITPVLACLAASPLGMLNVNADHVAAAVAAAYRAPVVFLSDVIGVLDDVHDINSLNKVLERQAINERIEDGRIAGGMIPKVESALHALEQGADYALIADGRSPESVQQALAGKAGTKIISRHQQAHGGTDG